LSKLPGVYWLAAGTKKGEGDHMKFGSRRTILAVMGLVAVCLFGMTSVGYGQAAQAPKPQMADDLFKNVTVLKGLQVDEFMDTMGMIAAALGLNCLDCHTSDADKSWERFAADTTMKQTSRRMIQMVNTINKEQFKGVRSVTCWTCHRGDLKPKIIPSLVVQYSAPMEDPNEVEIPPNSKGNSDEVFNKYINALGGAQALSRFTSYTAKGSYVGFDTHHSKVPVEIYAKAPNQKTLIIRGAFGDKTWTFDGKQAWAASVDKPQPLMDLHGGNLEGLKVEALVSFPQGLKANFAQWRVGTTGIDDKEVTVLQGTNPRQPPVNLYFDNTGLLVRLVRWVDTAIGRIPTQIDYADYRTVGGIKMPHKITSTWTDGQATIELTDVQANANIDPAKLSRPAPAKPKAD
jgi:photosynthetic reaction center cytochrome c subunit